MSIFPAADIVSDVARAADPAKVKVALRRLEDAAAARTHGSDFASTVERTRNVSWTNSAAPSRESAAPSHSSGGHALTAGQKFEAFILQSWLEILLPKDDAFGSGAGAGFWRSMMAEQLGAELASAGAIGLQKALDQNNASFSAS